MRMVSYGFGSQSKLDTLRRFNAYKQPRPQSNLKKKFFFTFLFYRKDALETRLSLKGVYRMSVTSYRRFIDVENGVMCLLG